MTFHQYLAACFKGTRPDDIRLGQHLMNQLSHFSPIACEEIMRQSEIDPYYDDDRVEAFLQFLQENWQELTKPLNSPEVK